MSGRLLPIVSPTQASAPRSSSVSLFPLERSCCSTYPHHPRAYSVSPTSSAISPSNPRALSLSRTWSSRVSPTRPHEQVSSANAPPSRMMVVVFRLAQSMVRVPAPPPRWSRFLRVTWRGGLRTAQREREARGQAGQAWQLRQVDGFTCPECARSNGLRLLTIHLTIHLVLLDRLEKREQSPCRARSR